MVVEYMENGSLASYLKTRDVPYEAKLVMARDVADGLAYVDKKEKRKRKKIKEQQRAQIKAH